MKMAEVLYRYDIKYMYSGIRKLQLNEYPIIKETRCGVWIDIDYGRNKFVNLQAHKKWACETPELAMTSFKIRKIRQVQKILLELEEAKIALNIAGIKYEIEHNTLDVTEMWDK
jgi:hypothetical protein